MGTASVPSSTLCLISGVANRDICFLDRKSLEPKELLWPHHWGCHFVSFVMHIYGAKFVWSRNLEMRVSIDLYSLSGLFSHCRPRDNILENSSFEIFKWSRVYDWILFGKKNKPPEIEKSIQSRRIVNMWKTFARRTWFWHVQGRCKTVLTWSKIEIRVFILNANHVKSKQICSDKSKNS